MVTNSKSTQYYFMKIDSPSEIKGSPVSPSFHFLHHCGHCGQEVVPRYPFKHLPSFCKYPTVPCAPGDVSSEPVVATQIMSQIRQPPARLQRLAGLDALPVAGATRRGPLAGRARSLSICCCGKVYLLPSWLWAWLKGSSSCIGKLLDRYHWESTYNVTVAIRITRPHELAAEWAWVPLLCKLTFIGGLSFKTLILLKGL